MSVFLSEPLQTILVLIAGFFTGVLSGMFGVGGAVVSTPAIRALGATPIEAIGSTLPSIIPSAISGSLRYHREGLIHWRVVLWTALVGCGAAVVGALLVDLVPGNGHLLMILTAALLAFTAYRTGQSPKRPDPADAEPPAGEDPDFADEYRRREPRPDGVVATGRRSASRRAAQRPARRRRRHPDGPGLRRLGAAPDQGGGRLLARVRRHPRGPGNDHPRAARPHRLGVRAPALRRGDPRRASARTSRSGRRTAGCDSRSRSCSALSRSSTRSGRSSALV